MLLISPVHALAGVYPFAVHHAYDRHSMVDFDMPDLNAFPAFNKVGKPVPSA